MPLPTNLQANEVKDRSGVAAAFVHFDATGRYKEYMRSGEAPALPERIKIQHRETGKAGVSLVRQSNVRTSKTILSQVDGETPVQIIISTSLYVPQGHLNDLNAVKDVVAYHNSLMASTGADTVVKFDGSGTASAALINGTI